jgi:hypothetical protein
MKPCCDEIMIDAKPISDEIRQLQLNEAHFPGRWTQIVFLWLIFRKGIILQCVSTPLSMFKLGCRYINTFHAILAHQFRTYMQRGPRSSDREIFVSIYGMTNTIWVYRVNGNIDRCEFCVYASFLCIIERKKWWSVIRQSAHKIRTQVMAVFFSYGGCGLAECARDEDDQLRCKT